MRLAERLQLPAPWAQQMLAAAASFPLRVPEAYLQRIKPGDPQDPLLLQVLPQAQELDRPAGYVTDPLGEGDANPHQGVIHKYRGRLLLIVSGGCAINCRYCFRRHFPYGDNQLGSESWQQALRYLRKHTDVEEVILSGGDPLATSDQRLGAMIDDLERLSHLKRLRIHTRLPIVIPDRVTPALTQRLAHSRLHTLLVTHINHPNEIDGEVRAALARLAASNTRLLNQSVLLKGINDKVSILKSLSEALFDCGVMPYYLHLMDPVAGAAHFDIGDQASRELVGKLAAELPGYLVPQLVREQAGAEAKVPLAPLIPGASGTP